MDQRYDELTLHDVKGIIKKLWSARTQTPLDLLESLRGTEVAARNDYAGRVVFEYFQNAIDRAEKQIDIVLDINQSGESAKLIFANDGKPVTIKAEAEVAGMAPVSDFHSLCAIFRSDKKPGETIGNKGVGFKSGWEFACQATIASTLPSHERWGFRLHQPLDLPSLESCSFWQELGESDDSDKKLRNDVARSLVLLGKAPSFLFPEFIGDAELHFRGLEWATTVIVLDGIDGQEKISRLEALIEEFRSARLFFVHQLRNRSPREIIVTTRVIKNGKSSEKIQTTELDGWTVVTANDATLPGWQMRREELAAEARKLNFEIKEPSLALAFPPQSAGKNLEDDPLFFCYLPTQVKVPVQGGIHIHADFLLDIARKHIADNPYNHGLLAEAARLLVRTVAEDSRITNRDDTPCFLSRGQDGQVPRFTKTLEKFLFQKDEEDDSSPWAVAYLKRAFESASLSDARHLNSLQFMKSWCYHEYNERWDTTNDRQERRLKLLASEKIPLIPLSVDHGTVKERTTFSSGKSENLFLRNLRNEDKPLPGLEVLSAPIFSGMAISTWSELENFRVFGVQEFKFDQVIATVRRAISQCFVELIPKTEAELGFSPSKLLNLIVALRRDMQNEVSANSGNLLQFLEGKRTAPTVAQELAWLPLPVDEGKWLPAFRVLLPAALPTKDEAIRLREEVHARGFRMLDADRLKSQLAAFLNANDGQAIALDIGAWPCLPLDLDRPDGDLKLSFHLEIATESYSIASEVWKSLVNAWPRWSAVHLVNSSRVKPIVDELRGEIPWFPLPASNRCVRVPDVCLTKGAPIKAEFIHEYRTDGDRESLLLSNLGIQLPEELDQNRLIRQLKRMSGFSPTEQLRWRYRSHMEALSKHEPIDHASIPHLVSRDGHFVWRSQSDGRPLWFVGRDHVAWRNYFRSDADFLELKPDASISWVKSLGIRVFEPTITPQGSELVLDDHVRTAIAQVLPYLILVAENSRVGGADVTIDKVLEQWQKLHFKRGSDVSLLLQFAGIDKPVGKRTVADNSQKDVVYVKDKHEIWHDMEDSTHNLSAFSGVLAQALFNIMLADSFEVCLTRTEAERSDWLQERYGVSDGQVAVIRERIAQHELSADVLAGIVGAVQAKFPAISAEDLRARWWDTSLYLEAKVDCSPADIIACLPEVARTVCGDLDPCHHNRMEWLSTCRQYAADVARAWLCEHASDKPERFLDLLSKLESVDDSISPPATTLQCYNFDTLQWLAHILRDKWSASIDLNESVVDWLARIRDDRIGWLRAGQLEKCIAQPVGAVDWSVADVVATSAVTVGLMTPSSDRAEVNIRNQSFESRKQSEEHKQIRGETAEVFLVLDTVGKLLNESIVDGQKRDALWDGFRAEWQKIPFANPSYKNELAQRIPNDPDKLLKELHLAKRLGDGLGFDVIMYVAENGTELLTMAEVKDIRSDRIFLSENERARAVQYAQMGIPWRLMAFVNGTGPYNLTQIVVEQAKLAGEKVKDLSLKPQEWVMQLKIKENSQDGL